MKKFLFALPLAALIILGPLWVSLLALAAFFFKVAADDYRETSELPDWKTL